MAALRFGDCVLDLRGYLPLFVLISVTTRYGRWRGKIKIQFKGSGRGRPLHMGLGGLRLL